MLWDFTRAVYLSLLGALVTADSLCIHLEELHNKLQYRHRVKYMKDYFPVSYTVQVHYEDIYRTINVTRMIGGWCEFSELLPRQVSEAPENEPEGKEFKYLIPKNAIYRAFKQPGIGKRLYPRERNRGFTEDNLKLLWIYINSQVLETVLEVLPKRHPSRAYVEDIAMLFTYLRLGVEKMIGDVEDERVEELLYRISDMDAESRRRRIRPKALFDNCYRVLKQIFHCNWVP